MYDVFARELIAETLTQAVGEARALRSMRVTTEYQRTREGLVPVTTTRMQWDAYTDPRPAATRDIDQRIERLFRLRRKRASLPADKVMVLFAEATVCCPDVRLDLLAALIIAAWNVDGAMTMRLTDEHASPEAICAVHAVVGDAAASGLIEVPQRQWNELCELESEARDEMDATRDVTVEPTAAMEPATSEPEPDPTAEPVPTVAAEPATGAAADGWVPLHPEHLPLVGAPEPIRADFATDFEFARCHVMWKAAQPPEPFAPFALAPIT